MKSRSSRFLNVAMLVAALALAGCDSAEERAEQYYQSGLKFVASGEIDKALIEFRNVFKFNGEHLEARLEYARILTERGDFDQGTSQYLRVLEQVPANRTARLAVSQAMLRFQNFEEAEKHAAELIARDPRDVDGLAVRASALMRLNRQVEAVVIAKGILSTNPANVGAMMVLISDEMNHSRMEKALELASEAIRLVPGELSVYLAKLAVLEQLKRNSEITALLEQMAARFPENEEITQTRIGWMLETGDASGAERLLREVSANEPDNVEAALNVVGLIEQERGIDAAFAELKSLADRPGASQNSFRRAFAAMTFRLGKVDEAIALAQELFDTTAEGNDRNESAILLAFLLFETGEPEKALALAEAVIAADSGNVDALKMRGQIKIGQDNYDAAIADLRAAQDADPTDASVLVLQAKAHDLNGSPDLARERLAAAVSISGAQPEIAMEYARLLMQEDKTDIAESVLLESSQRYPGNRNVLILLANARLMLENWSGAEAAAERIRGLAANGIDPDADTISVAVLQGQNKIEESIGLLQTMLSSGDSEQKDATLLNIVQTHLEAGQTDIAEKFLVEHLAKSPSDYTANLLLAGIYTISDRPDEAEARYRKVITDHPTQAGGYIMLARLLMNQGRNSESSDILGQGMKDSADTSRIQFMRAGDLELAGDFEGAIEIYSQLYEQTPGSDLLANNLASLLSEHRTDQASLDKAFTVSKRLRATEFPPFQDTYAWVLYLRGDYERAMEIFTKAEAALGDNPIFMFHLGMTYAKLGQKELAVSLLEKAVRVADEAGLILPQMEIAKTELADLKAPAAN